MSRLFRMPWTPRAIRGEDFSRMAPPVQEGATPITQEAMSTCHESRDAEMAEADAAPHETEHGFLRKGDMLYNTHTGRTLLVVKTAPYGEREHVPVAYMLENGEYDDVGFYNSIEYWNERNGWEVWRADGTPV